MLTQIPSCPFTQGSPHPRGMNVGGAAGLKGHVRSWGNNPSLGTWAMGGVVQSLLPQPRKAKETAVSWKHLPLQAY